MQNETTVYIAQQIKEEGARGSFVGETIGPLETCHITGTQNIVKLSNICLCCINHLYETTGAKDQ